MDNLSILSPEDIADRDKRAEGIHHSRALPAFMARLDLDNDYKLDIQYRVRGLMFDDLWQKPEFMAAMNDIDHLIPNKDYSVIKDLYQRGWMIRQHITPYILDKQSFPTDQDLREYYGLC